MNRLKELREARSLKQADICILMQIAKSTYSYWENGRTEPDQNSLIKLAHFYNVTIDYLIGNNSQNEKTTDNTVAKIIADLSDAGLTVEKYNNMTEEHRADFLQLVKILAKNKK